MNKILSPIILSLYQVWDESNIAKQNNYAQATSNWRAFSKISKIFNSLLRWCENKIQMTAKFFKKAARAGLLLETAKKGSWPVTGLWNRGPLKILNGIKLILDDQGNHLDSYTISFESFRYFRGPLFHKPVTGQELVFCCFLQQTGFNSQWKCSNNSPLILSCKLGFIGLVLVYFQKYWLLCKKVEDSDLALIWGSTWAQLKSTFWD